MNPFEASPRATPAPEDLEASAKSVAVELLSIIDRDRNKLQLCDDYLNGRHRDPYMPDSANAEYKLLAKRAVRNWIPLITSTPAQALYVDSFRAGDQQNDSDEHQSAAWKHWQASNMDARQHAVYRGSFTYGHSFVVTEKEQDGKVRSRGLSARKTAAIYDDPANDLAPYAALTIHRPARWNAKQDQRIPGTAYLWDQSHKFEIAFDGTTVKSAKLLGVHGATSCPVTRFACAVDLEGRTVGLVEPIIELQDAINQTNFDLLIAQSYGSFKVRYVSGMAPPLLTEPIIETDQDGNEVIVGNKPVLDEDTGKPIPLPIQANASRFMFAQDPETKWGQLDETPLGGYIQSVDMSVKHLSAITQTPPHYLLGEIANISADALQAAETSLSRKVTEFRSIFGEAWERVFRVAAELSGDTSAAQDDAAEVVWRDLDASSLSKVADALGKLHDQIGAPKKALWKRVPGMTQTEFGEWEKYADEEDAEQAKLADSLDRALGPRPQQQEDVNGTASSEQAA